MFADWYRRLFGQHGKSARSGSALAAKRRTQLGLESLEARAVPATAALDQGALVIDGTAAGDVIVIESRPAHASQIRVMAGGRSLGNFSKAAVDGIVAYGHGGNDTIIVNAQLNIPAELHGEAGNDRLYGGRGSDLLLGGEGNDSLFGGGGSDLLDGDYGNDWLDGQGGDDVLYGCDGNDMLFGRAGRDILIGAEGSDSLDGGADDDILIGGTSDYEENDFALFQILTEWRTPAAAATRIDHLTSGGGLNDPFLFTPGITVQSDGAQDRLIGGLGFDWFLRSATDPDQVLDLNASKDRVDNT